MLMYVTFKRGELYRVWDDKGCCYKSFKAIARCVREGETIKLVDSTWEGYQPVMKIIKEY